MEFMLQDVLKSLPNISDKRREAVQSKVLEIQTSEYSKLIKHIYLFGSMARGEANAMSDMDLMIEVKDDVDRRTRTKIICEFIDELSSPPVDISTAKTDYLFNSEELFPRLLRRDMIQLI